MGTHTPVDSLRARLEGVGRTFGVVVGASGVVVGVVGDNSPLLLVGVDLVACSTLR